MKGFKTVNETLQPFQVNVSLFLEFLPLLCLYSLGLARENSGGPTRRLVVQVGPAGRLAVRTLEDQTSTGTD